MTQETGNREQGTGEEKHDKKEKKGLISRIHGVSIFLL